MPTSSPTAARSSKGFTRTRLAQLELSTLPPMAGFSTKVSSLGWCTHNEDVAWLFKPAERIFFHVASETLWRADLAKNALVRLQDMRGRALAALVAPQEKGLLRLCFSEWRQLVGLSAEAHQFQAKFYEPFVHNANLQPDMGQDPVADSLLEALEALRGYSTSNADAAYRAVLRLRHLHKEVSQDWNRRSGAGKSTATDTIGAGTSKSPVAFFHARFRGLLRPAAHDKHSPVRCDPSVESPETEAEIDLQGLKTALADEIRFRRLRGALSFGGEVWSDAHNRTGEVSLQVAAAGAMNALFTLDAVTQALPGVLGTSQDSFVVEEYTNVGDMPSALRVALRQLGPL